MLTIGDLHKEAGVDKTHLRGHKPIKKWICGNEKCKFKTTDIEKIEAQTTLGTWGPNGNGWNYWCPKCKYRMEPSL